MKRSKPLKADPQTTAAWQRRSRKPLKSSRRDRPRISDETMEFVRARQDGLCACGCGRAIAPAPIGYHHVFPKARWKELVDVTSNVVGVAADCHANHETGHTRLPRAAIACAEGLAETPAMENFLTRTYGPPQGAGPALAPPPREA